MRTKQLLPSLVLAGMALGTAWAVRGQFGHEHGAAWAGGIGCLTVLLLSGRTDWMKIAFQSTLAGALGWGLGGMMSYGQIVGYARSTDFSNVYYGLLMLFVVGGLYGFVGGGLFGISLSNTKTKEKIAWHQLIVEMTVGAVAVYFFVIYQFGWLMTPPRSEEWAACLGMAAALTWYMVRQEMYSALRVALITGFGAGFGFALGNFFQVIGHVLEIKFNFWNVMEYTLGFFGGSSMAYAVFTSEWEEKIQSAKSRTWLVAAIVLLLVIPLIMWEQNTYPEKMHKNLSQLSVGIPFWFSSLVVYVPYLLFFAVSYYWISKTKRQDHVTSEHMVGLYRIYFGLYILLSILVTGAFLSIHRIEQYLYLVNFAVILYYLPKTQPTFSQEKMHGRSYAMNMVWFLVFTAILAVVASSSHSEDLRGAHYRFGEKATWEKK
jgi:hypothetical protein